MQFEHQKCQFMAKCRLFVNFILIINSSSKFRKFYTIENLKKNHLKSFEKLIQEIIILQIMNYTLQILQKSWTSLSTLNFLKSKFNDFRERKNWYNFYISNNKMNDLTNLKLKSTKKNSAKFFVKINWFWTVLIDRKSVV